MTRYIATVIESVYHYALIEADDDKQAQEILDQLPLHEMKVISLSDCFDTSIEISDPTEEYFGVPIVYPHSVYGYEVQS